MSIFKVLKYYLISLSSEGEISKTDCLIIYINLMLANFPGIKPQIIQNLKVLKFDIVNEVDFLDWASEEPGLLDIDYPSRMEEIEGLTVSIIATLTGLISVFIGRQMTPVSFPNWISRRQIAFAKRTCIEQDDDNYVVLLPTLGVAANLYNAIAPRTQLRRTVFKLIRDVSSADESVWGSAFKVSMVYLMGSEMSHFIFIVKYILVENPILLSWNELAKLTPKLYAAFSKWCSLGDNAPYCKLIYPPEQVSEFNRQNLDTLASVARAIAQHSGKTSVMYYKGVNTDTDTNAIVEHTLRIVKAYGGARTHNTTALEENILIAEDNKALRDLLYLGAQEIKTFPDDSIFNPPVGVAPRS